jgi:hypothetical protein
VLRIEWTNKFVVFTAMNSVKISIDRLIMNQSRHSLVECLFVLTWDAVRYLENVDRPDARVDMEFLDRSLAD